MGQTSIRAPPARNRPRRREGRACSEYIARSLLKVDSHFTLSLLISSLVATDQRASADSRQIKRATLEHQTSKPCAHELQPAAKARCLALWRIRCGLTALGRVGHVISVVAQSTPRASLPYYHGLNRLKRNLPLSLIHRPSTRSHRKQSIKLTDI
ncbi:hypothetical protein EDB81DRAFT_447066 [Dactylonectria macrodidyma]|uniref:Uncharacterized protein n=1 Tax=Dactylonectria macrodidyma TaxID=307937 RepID=A0A9P9F5D3_9HYPO|nr:hypothetical protein EDB81DRAFT_447066 [Dactylonectria macrodidyma]